MLRHDDPNKPLDVDRLGQAEEFFARNLIKGRSGAKAILDNGADGFPTKLGSFYHR